jgi:hypothetical protein
MLKPNTNDSVIRNALKRELAAVHADDKRVRIIEEFGLMHGAARIDVAVVNGILHGYEIKSDRDTLFRLPDQMQVYNSVFDQVTLVVGKSHIFEAINTVPDWWGIRIAKVMPDHSVAFYVIRESRENTHQNSLSIARLLWRQEALDILEQRGEARGLRSKSRTSIYERLSNIFDQRTLAEKVREAIFIRQEWRPDAPLVLNGG